MTTISYPTLIPRPKEYVSGVWSWLTTVDHKKNWNNVWSNSFLLVSCRGIEHY